MPDWLSIHEPVLVNTIGHCAGTVIFGMLLYFFLVNWRRAREERSRLPAIAAALALVWNIGSLIALASGPASGMATDIIVAASFSVLSLLPAVLLHISLESHHRTLWMSGYVLSLTAVALHVVDLLTRAPRFHYAALLLVTLGFAWLTVIFVILEMRQRNRAAISRLAGAMVLFLFAISFVHFSSEHVHEAWSKEIALHHAGIPLALFVLLQDYRFLLLDAFLRFVVNASLAAAALLISIRIVQSPDFGRHLQHPFDAGLFFVSACLLLTLFVYIRNRIQGLLTRVIFLRSNVEDTLHELRHSGRAIDAETEYLRHAAELIASFVRAKRFDLTEDVAVENGVLATPATVMEAGKWRVPSWVHAVVPLRFSKGDTRYLLLGPRDGGRRYLSEDLVVLTRLGASVVEQVEQLRGVQMQNLVSQAELRALQAQINPHFLFNSLNTLYGTIDRGNAEARRLVLSLSEVFRYLLRTDRTFIEIEEELKIVRAYLEIEKLRLGPKLRTEIQIDDAALHATIPMLSIQPLVENAVKHGVAPRTGTGFVRLSITAEGGVISVTVSNSGEFDTRALTYARDDGGKGLANVRRRLQLCYGEESRFKAQAGNGITNVGFFLPLKLASAM
jgi:two-component system LytT family sensor kinase